MSASYPLPNNLNVCIDDASRVTEIKIFRDGELIVHVTGSKKSIATERAFDALQDYCFGRPAPSYNLAAKR